MDPILNKGYNLCTDNWYTSFELSKELLKKKTTIVGTLKKNKPQIPEEMNKVKNREKFDVIFGFQKYLTLLSYCTKANQKHVLVLSSLHKDDTIEDDGKPMIINDYNHMKVGVDALDQILQYYSCRRASNRWPITVFMHILDLACYNSYIIYQKKYNEYTERKNFIIDLCKEISSKCSKKIKVDEVIENSISLTTKRSRCYLCDWRNDKKIATDV